MRKLVLATLSAGAFIALAPLAHAMPLANVGNTDDGTITRVAGGCGPGFFRGPYGGCRPMMGRPMMARPFMRPRPCPPGYHLGPMGQRCRPNF